MSNHEGDPKVPDLPAKTVLTFAAYSVSFGSLALLVWVLYQLFKCGCG